MIFEVLTHIAAFSAGALGYALFAKNNADRHKEVIAYLTDKDKALRSELADAKEKIDDVRAKLDGAKQAQEKAEQKPAQPKQPASKK